MCEDAHRHEKTKLLSSRFNDACFVPTTVVSEEFHNTPLGLLLSFVQENQLE